MKYVWQVLLLFYASLPCTVQERENLKITYRLSNILKNIIKDVNPYRMAFLSHELERSDAVREINELSKAIFKSVPFYILSIAKNQNDKINYTQPILSKDNMVKMNFIVGLYEARNSSQILKDLTLIDLSRKISDNTQKPKCLLIIFLQSESDSLEPLMGLMWNKKLFDVTILEVVIRKIHGGGIAQTSEVNKMIVHQYNEFVQSYTKRLYSPDVTWFPEKLRNIQKSKITVEAVIVPWNKSVRLNRKCKLSGRDGYIFKTFFQFINASAVIRQCENITNKYHNHKKYRSRIRVAEGKSELLINHVMYLNREQLKGIQNSIFVESEKYCALVPLYTNVEVKVSHHVIISLLWTFAIVIISWILSIVFKFPNRIWNPANVFIILCGMPVSRKPYVLKERIAFGIVILISISYSSVAYSILTETFTINSKPIHIRSFDELDKSGLIPVVNRNLYNNVFKIATGPLLNLKNKAIIYDNLTQCIVDMVTYRNTTCLMWFKEAEVTVHKINNYLKNVQDDELRFEIMQPCFWLTLQTYVFHKNSPYVDKFNKFLRHLLEGGLTKKWRDNEVEADASHFYKMEKQKKFENREQQRKFIWDLCVVLGCGHLIAFIVFLLEIIVAKITSKRSSNV
ncbi:Ionotropic receptor 112 [Cephus cinctus]|nr:Ionotropic receptor 112 [Cephus cinctus]